MVPYDYMLKELLFLIIRLGLSGWLLTGSLHPAWSASSTNGTINTTNKYAWGENIGWVSFGTSEGNVVVTDSALSGYAYGENTGWISLNCSNDNSCVSVDYKVANDGEGYLSGYAWGENVGWISFNPQHGGVSIDATGDFNGYAWGENIGWIVFNCATTNSCGSVSYKVSTDWRPQSSRSSTSPTPTQSTEEVSQSDITAPDFEVKKIGTVDYLSKYTVYYYTGLTPLFYGTGEIGSQVSLRVDGNLHAYQPTINTNGEWSIPDYTFTIGSHKVQLSASDAAGNQSLIAFTLVIDPTMQLFPDYIRDQLTEGGPSTEPEVLIPIGEPKENVEPEAPIEPTPQDTPPTGAASETPDDVVLGNALTVRLVDKGSGQPLAGVTVTLHSEPKRATSDANGIVVFEDVEPGQHTLAFSYMGENIERVLNLQGNGQEFHIEIEVSVKGEQFLGVPSWVWAGSALILVVVVMLMAHALWRTRRARSL